MLDYGIKVSLPTKDANVIPSSVTAIRDNFSLVSSSQFSLLKAKARNRVTVTNGTTMTIPHGLPYKPIAFVFEQLGGVIYQIYDVLTFGNSSRAWIDTTNLNIQCIESSPTNYYYYIFYDAM